MNLKRNSIFAIVLALLLISIPLADIFVKQWPEGSLNSQPLPKPASQFPDSTVKLEGRALVETLNHGGYVIYFDLATNRSTPNNAGLSMQCGETIYDSGLSKDGAQAMGAALKALKIPIGKVLSSELCQVAEKAKIIFD